MSDDNVVHIRFGSAYPLEAELKDKIDELIYSYAGRISVVSVLGVLKVVETDLIANAYDND